MTDDFRSLYDAAPCGLLSTDPDGRITRVNATLLAWSGFSEDDLVGATFADLLSRGSRLFYETRHLPTLRLEGVVHEVALSLRRADGSVLAVLLNSTTARDASGAITRIDTAVFDSTRRQDWERQLLAARREAETSEARTRALQTASAAFAACDTEEALADALAGNARSAFSAAASAVHLTGGGGYLLAGGSQPFELDRALSARELGGTVQLVTARDGDDPLSAALDAARVEELTVTPLLDGEIVIGAVSCFFGRARGLDDAAAELHYALARQAVQVLRRIRLQAQLEAYALHDPLTGLANRNLLRTRLSDAVTAAAQGTPIALVFIDLDGFKEINDLFDHTTGDAVLREVSTRVEATVRREDIVGRFGGDEFLVICEDADEDAARAIAERVRESIRRPLRGIADERAISASIGVAVYRTTGREPLSPADIFRFADAAMYRSKDAGKDRVSVTTI